MKRIVSTLIVIALIFGLVPNAVYAEEVQTAVDNSDITVEGTNGFGALLSAELEEEQQEKKQGEYIPGYNIISLTIENNVASIEYATLETAVLVVAIYTEDGLQLLVSNNTVVQPEETVVEVTLKSEMPEYFIASAYLLDTYDYSPLCKAYETPMYTQEMQELLASTVEDFDADKVLNLDDDNTTNFAVYADTTIVVEAQEGVNIVVSADDESATYVIENADQNIVDLQIGQVFIYPYSETEILIVKVASISVDGKTATIKGDDLELEEAFSHVKIEGMGSTQDLIFDDSTADAGVIYEGIAQEHEPYSLYAFEDEIGGKYAIKFGLEKKISEAVKLKGSLSLDFSVKFSYYISSNRQFVEFEAKAGVKAAVSINGKAVVSLPLGSFGFSPVPGVYIGFEPELQAEFEGKVEFSIKYEATFGFSYEWGKGGRDLCNASEVETDIEIEGKVFVGVDFCPHIDIIGGTLFDAELEAPIGVELEVKPTGTNVMGFDAVSDVVHTCKECFDIEAILKAEFSVKLKFLKSKLLTFDSKPIVAEATIGEMYLSVDNGEYLPGNCPHQTYRVTVNVIDDQMVGIAGVEVFSETGENWGCTNKHGVIIKYLPSGEHTVTATLQGETLTETFDVTEARFVSIAKKSETIETQPGFSGSFTSEIIKDKNLVAFGQCGVSGRNVTWTLDNDGVLTISGTGAMQNYSSSEVPWGNYKNVITTVVIKDGVTSIGDWAFYNCGYLTDLMLPNSLTRIGDYVFKSCGRMKDFVFPNNLVTIGRGAFWDCDDLVNVTIPRNAVDIGQATFYYCDGLERVAFSQGTTNIAREMFSFCYNLNEVIIAESVTSIGTSAFYCCDNLTSITIPKGVTAIEGNPFRACENLARIHVSPENTAFSNDAFGVLFDKTKSTLIAYPYARKGTYDIPNTVTQIGNSAFSYCDNLTDIYIPDSVTDIGGAAFSNCWGLTSIIIPASVERIEGFAFGSLYKYVNNITFKGDTPVLDNYAFYNTTITINYPANNATWTGDVLKNYGGVLTWVPYTSGVNNALYESKSVVSDSALLTGKTESSTNQGEAYEASDVSDTSVRNDIEVFATWEDEAETSGAYTMQEVHFSCLVPGAEYVILALISTETENILASDNLLYVVQKTAADDGTLSLEYIQYISTDTLQVVACGASNQNMEDANVIFEQMIADEQEQAVAFTVEYGDKLLIEGQDYVVVGMVSYTQAGSYTCYIRGIRNYTGFVEFNYIVNSETDAVFKFSGASLSLQHNLAVNYKVDKALFEDVGYTDPYVVFELNGVKTEVSSYTVSGDRYVFTFRNIAPNQMNDTISATLYATYDSVEYASVTREYSVAEYCHSMLEEYADDQYAELRTLLVDLLNYGAASQVYTGYKTDALVNASLTDTQLQWGTSSDPVLESVLNTTYKTVEAPAAVWKGGSLYLQDTVAMRFKFTAEDADGLSVIIESGGKAWTLSSDQFVEENGVYFVYFAGLNAGQMRQNVFLTVYDGETAVSNTVCYSIESYAYEKQNSTISGLSELVKAMMKYGDSAYAYVN